MMDGGDMHELTGAYVLDALSPAETRAFQEHLQHCPSCRVEVQQLRDVVGALPLAVEEVEPPANLFGRIQDTIETERPVLKPITGGRTTPRRPVPWSYLEIALAGIAAVFIVALGVWNIHLQNQISNDRSALAYQSAIYRAIQQGGTVAIVPGTGSATTASAAFVQPPSRQHPYLIVNGLPAPQSGHVYEVWLIKPRAQPVPAGVFNTGGSGPEIWQLPRSATGFSVTAVTEEAGPHGSPVPQGPKVLAGAIRS
jgi:anti-sigma-K factor RskA